MTPLITISFDKGEFALLSEDLKEYILESIKFSRTRGLNIVVDTGEKTNE